MGVLKWIIVGVAVVVVVLAVVFLIGFFRMMYYSIPYDEWVEMQKKTESKKEVKDYDRQVKCFSGGAGKEKNRDQR